MRIINSSLIFSSPLGAVRSHLSDFKKHRAARIDHYVVEVNKLIIRLEKVNFASTNFYSVCYVNDIYLILRELHRTGLAWTGLPEVNGSH